MQGFRLSCFGFCLLAAPAFAGDEATKALYREHCADCHGADRLGGTGPALIPENLGRLKPEKAAATITEGRQQTQMPGFGDTLDAQQIEALTALVFEPLPVMPTLDMAAIEATREVAKKPEQLVAAPIHDSDPMNLFVVVESGDHHVTILDGDRFEPITRFPSRYALHGGPKFSPDGRFVHFASRDGWITRYDLWGLETVAEIRAGINTRNIAISADGSVLAVANYLPHSLVLLDAATLAPLEVIETTDLRGEKSSRVSAVYQAAPRDSFVVAMKDMPELWEVSYVDPPPEGYGSFVHSHETGMVEAADEGRFPIRRTELKEPLDDFFFDQSYRHVIGSARDGGRGVVVQLDVRREIAELPLPGLPHLGSGISWDWQGKRIMATPHLKEGAVSVIDIAGWQVIKTIETEGPGFFMRSHKASPYAFVDVFFGPNKDAVHVIDKETLEIAQTLRPEPGKTAAHVEFTRDGRYALLSIWDMEGAVIVTTPQPLKRSNACPWSSLRGSTMSGTKSTATKAPATDRTSVSETLVIAVHGIRGNVGGAVEHAERIAGNGRFVDVRVACLKGTPELGDVVADLAGRDVILAPLLMADGYTLKAMQRRLEPIIPTLRTFRSAAPLGVHPGLANKIVETAKKVCREKGWPLAETDLLIAAHGTRRDPDSGKSAFDHVETIREKNIFAAVRTGFLDQSPTLKNVIAASRACHVVVGLFIDRGEHGEEDIPAILEDADPQAIYTGPIGIDPGITDLLLAQIDAARALTPVA